MCIRDSTRPERPVGGATSGTRLSSPPLSGGHPRWQGTSNDARNGGDGGRSGGGRSERSSIDACATPERYVSAYDSAQKDHLVAKGEAPEIGAETDDKAHYAKLIEFSRYRREELGQRRAPDDPNRRRTRQSAPRAFGTNDHGRGMEFEEDLEGGTRIDVDAVSYTHLTLPTIYSV